MMNSGSVEQERQRLQAGYGKEGKLYQQIDKYTPPFRSMSYFYMPAKLRTGWQHIQTEMQPRGEEQFSVVRRKMRALGGEKEKTKKRYKTKDEIPEERLSLALSLYEERFREILLFGQFCEVGVTVKMGKEQDWEICKKEGNGESRKVFYRSMNFTAPKFLPEQVQAVQEMIYPAASLLPVCGFDPFQFGKQKKLGLSESTFSIQEELTNRNFSKFFPPCHRQCCDICGGPLRFMDLDNKREFLHMKSASVIPSEFRNILFNEALICPCKELFLCVQTSFGDEGCTFAFQKAKKKLMKELTKKIEKCKKEGKYRAKVTLVDRNGSELSEEDAHEKRTHRKKKLALGNGLMLDEDGETERVVVELNGDQMAVMEYFQRKTHKICEKMGVPATPEMVEVQSNIRGQLALRYCRKILAKTLFSESHLGYRSGDPNSKAYWEKVRSQFIGWHDCSTCTHCPCAWFTEAKDRNIRAATMKSMK